MLKINKIQNTGVQDAGDSPALLAPAPGTVLERMLRYGPKALSSGELLAIVLGPGGPVVAGVMAALLLTRYGSLSNLAAAAPQMLARQFGMGWARSGRVAAALELGARLAAPARKLGLVVRGPDDLTGLLEDEFRGCDREHFLAVYLDTRHRIVAIETVSVGSLNASLVHPREVFKPAVALGIAAVIAAHNHPSGCARPSADDLELTARLARCGSLLGIELLDHLIVGRGEIVSLRQYGWPPEEEPRGEGGREMKDVEDV
jgi:DNA repair protein RadC